jgi:hypothetical protein
MNENPWCSLPTSSPYVLPEDEPNVSAFNKMPGRKPNHVLQLDILPEPFIGVPDAPVVLLSNNPGFGKRAHLKHEQDFIRRMRNNLHHEPSDCPFVYLAPDIGDVGKWWESKLKTLIHCFGREVVARSILNVPYFPYPSRTFAHRRLELPSQKYSFYLVREAVNRRAVVVLMRRGKLKLWQSAVPELKEYDRLVQLLNPQNPTVSPGNCHDGDYEKVVRAIEVAETNR